MFRTMMKSKIHRARVTKADLNYVGSITIDIDILEQANILPNEKVSIVNNNNGARFETYVIAGIRGKREFCLNGAAARLVQPGDVIIIISYAMMSNDEALNHQPTVLIMDDNNNISEQLQKEKPSTVK